jgi:hypothetical protein
MITLRWAPFPGSNVASYKVYRSIIGVTGVRPPDLTTLIGKTIILRANCKPTATTITLTGGNPVDDINAAAQGFRAYDSSLDVDQFLIRSDIREQPGSLQVVGGTALADLGLSARTVVEKSEDSLIATLPANPDPEAMLEFQDPDGVVQDWYAISTIDAYNNESRKSNYKQPITSTGPVCSIEGIITDLQGVRVPDAEISAKLVAFPHSPESASHVTLAPITTRTGSDGRFSLVLLQGALVELGIPAIGFFHNIRVPEQSYVFITDLRVDLDYQYPLGYINAPGAPSGDTATGEQ